MLDLIGNPNCWNSHAVAHIIFSKRYRVDLLKKASSRISWDGLNNITYTVLRHELRPLYTWILVTFKYDKDLVKFKHKV